uniref:Uncharacterized protein n=1 Tax=Anguilla anguilla TaxID=7936 RepID=A0A0E9V394_ANGAN
MWALISVLGVHLLKRCITEVVSVCSPFSVSIKGDQFHNNTFFGSEV